MTGHEFRAIRLGLGLTQKELSRILGYAHKIRVSEYERSKNPIEVPLHIGEAMLQLQRGHGVAPEAWGSVREWTRRAA